MKTIQNILDEFEKVDKIGTFYMANGDDMDINWDWVAKYWSIQLTQLLDQIPLEERKHKTKYGVCQEGGYTAVDRGYNQKARELKEFITKLKS